MADMSPKQKPVFYHEPIVQIVPVDLCFILKRKEMIITDIAIMRRSFSNLFRFMTSFWENMLEMLIYLLAGFQSHYSEARLRLATTS